MKYTPSKLSEARQDKSIIKWRASGKNGTLIANPTVTELKSQAEYSKVCGAYITLMLQQIISTEKKLYDAPLELKCEEYYVKRYDVTAVENKILRNQILSKL